MSIPTHPPARRWFYFGLRVLLIAAIMAGFTYLNRAYFFHDRNYESGDLAANTLSVLRAERGAELHGNYSRWEFRHPGPALFYGAGWSELALYRWWHLVPTPYTAQVLFTLLLTASFFAAGLSVAVRWVRGGVFLWLAFAGATIVFTAANPTQLFLMNWPPYLLTMPMFALVIAAASVAAGDGDDLPLLALAGCFLLHLHVAQPLFVGPVWAVAYAGLAWTCWQRRALASGTVPASAPDDQAGVVAAPQPPVAARASALPWQVYRRSHRRALIISAIFALPILIDLFSGPDSNFGRILGHLRAHHGEGHKFIASLHYFLRFAVFDPSRGDAQSAALPVGAKISDLTHFLSGHAGVLALWLAALLSPLLTVAARLWRGRDEPLLGDAPAAQPLTYTAPVGRWRFLGALWLTWALAVGLTLCWGHLQDGPLFYFNAWFDYALWCVLALLAAASVTDALDACAYRSERAPLWRGVAGVAGIGLAAYIFAHYPDRFRPGSDEDARKAHETATAVLDTEPAGTARDKLLVFPPRAWGEAAEAAVTLTRRGRGAEVLPDWEFLFGPDHGLPDWQEYLAKPREVNVPQEVWHFVPAALATGVPGARPWPGEFALVPGGLPVDPVAPFRLVWGGEEPNYLGYVAAGWTPLDGDGAAHTVGKAAWLQFRPVPVPAGSDVELTLDCSPVLVSEKRDAQRIAAFLNGNALGELRVTGEAGAPGKFVVPGAIWNRYPSVLLAFSFPDALAPSETGRSADPRPAAFKIRGMTFAATSPAVVPPVVAPEAAPQPTPVPVATPGPTVTPEPTPSAIETPMPPVAEPTPMTSVESSPEPAPSDEPTPAAATEPTPDPAGG